VRSKKGLEYVERHFLPTDHEDHGLPSIGRSLLEEGSDGQAAAPRSTCSADCEPHGRAIPFAHQHHLVDIPLARERHMPDDSSCGAVCERALGGRSTFVPPRATRTSLRRCGWQPTIRTDGLLALK
jgi:hypothetical protein